MLQSYIPLIKLNRLFKNIPQEQFPELFIYGSYSIDTYKKNSIIHFESEMCLSLDIILRGEVIIQRIDENGNVLTITDFQSGDNIGGNLLFSNNPFYPMTIIAKSDTKILHVNKNLVLKLCQLDMDFLYEFLTCISDKTTILTNKIKAISAKSIKNSIIDFLKYEYYLQNNNQIKLSMTKKELAERLGIQRTSLSRELNKMRKDQLIEFDTHSITITNLDLIR